ncbi:MAG: competence/damage-inducible protein A [Hyphomicrobiaceae bacterium]|nr:competence/damage-inducible protein A [Hyphomicrobiaceae bacterium]
MSDDNTTAAPPSPDDVTAAILVIGDEILSGRTKDRNIGHIADVLTATGINVRECRVVPDVEADIVAAVTALRSRYTYLFTTGGIGPTHDDITADAIAEAFAVGIDVDERALALMRPHYERRGLELTPSRLRMARLPAGCEIIANRISAAPGFMIGNVIVMAGVPQVMQVMLDEVLPRLRTGRPMLSQSVRVRVPEGEIADLFTAHQQAFPDVAMGSYPSFTATGMRCELVLRSIDAERLAIAVGSLRGKLEALGFLGSD